MIAITRASALGLTIAALATGALIGNANASDAAPATAGEQDVVQLGEGLRGEGFEVTVDADSLSVGKKGFINVVIKAKAGFKVNQDYPHKIKFKNVPDGVKVPTTVKKKDGAFEGKSAFRFKVPVTASKAGKFKVGGKLKFSVCNDKSCIIKKKNIKVSLKAK